MRRCWLIAILLLVVGCSKDIDFEPSQDQAQNRILSGIIADEKDEDNESRVYLDNKIRIRWNKGDLISVFDGTTRNKEFAFLGADGSSAGDFEDNSAGTIGTGNAIDRLYGLYPYASSTEYCYGEDESEADYLRYTLPTTQTYKPNSIGLNANLMVAATANKSDKTLVFRNVCSYLRLKLYGADQTVSSIAFKGNTDEVLTGDVAITATYGNAPTIKMLGAAEEDNKTITLDCSEGVAIGSTSDEATEFWLVVPPVNFPNGFTITVKGEGNMGQEIVVNNNLTFARNTYNTITREVAMTEVSDPSTEIPDNEIWYTATEKVTPYNTDVFGAAIVANEWDSATGNGVITFSHAIISIGERAFEDCSSLTSITLPAGITQIGDYAFYFCTSLASITLPESLTQIEYSPFAGCGALSKFDGKFASADGRYLIDDGVLLAFAPSGLTEYTLPEGVTQIGAYAFSYCTSLTSITLPESLTQIGASAFIDCTSLIEVYCKPTTPPAGGISMFHYNAPGRKIYVPAGSGEAYKTAQYWSDYASIIEEMGSETPPDNEIWYTATAKVTPYKTDVFGANIVSNTYENGKGVIKFDGAVTSIGESAFYRCSRLTEITIPNSVTSIGNYAFEDCSSLTEVTIGNGVTSIGDSAFEGCSSLTEVTIGNSVTSIGSLAFAFCESLTEITIPNSVTSIGDQAFVYCSSLTDVSIGNSVTSIGRRTFCNCRSLTEITIPNSVTNIGSLAFDGCSSLQKFYGKFAEDNGRCLVNDGVLIAYAEASGTEYTIPNSVTSIGDGAFYGCNSLTEITIPNSVTSIGNSAFYECSSLTEITIPNSVTSIEYSAFGGCSSLTSITIPNSVTSIGAWTFGCCSSLTEITIPNSVTSIGGQAFGGCSSLQNIFCKPTTPPTGDYDMFYGIHSSAKIYVPEGSVNSYKTAQYWKDYASLITPYNFE